MHKHSMKFADFECTGDYTLAQTVVERHKKLTEEQCRWILFVSSILVFGNPALSLSPGFAQSLLLRPEGSDDARPIWEAQLMFLELVMSRTDIGKQHIADFRRDFELTYRTQVPRG